MAVSVSTVASQVVAQMNLNTSYSSSVTDPRAYTSQVSDAVLSADGMVVEAICSNPTNGRWRDFRTTASVAHQGALPSRIGSIGSVIVNSKIADEFPATEVEWERGTSLTYLTAHYAVKGGVLVHNQGASNATVEYATYTRTSACQAPDEYGDVVLCGALALMFSIEGEDTNTAAFYGQQFQSMIQMIRGGQVPTPLKLERAA